MKSIFKSPGVIAGVVLVLVVSAWVGWQLGGREETSSESGGEAAKSSGSAARHGRRGHPGPPAAVQRELNRIRAIKEPAEQMRAVIDLVRTMPLDEYQKWIEEGWFNYREGFALSLFHKVGMERWKLEDPMGYVTWSRKEDNGGAARALVSWIGGDPTRFEQYFEDASDDAFQVRVLNMMARDEPAFALDRFLQLVARGSAATNSDYQIQSMFQNVGKKAPEVLEAVLEEMPLKYRRLAENALVAGRLERSIDTEFAALLERPDGWRLLQNSANQVKGVGDKLLAELADLPDAWKQSLASNAARFIYRSDPEAWYKADYAAAGFTEEQAKQMRSIALSYYAGKNPSEALALLLDSEIEGAYRGQIVRNIFSQARNDPEKANAWMGLLQSEEDRKIASTFLTPPADQKEFRESLKNPDGWLEKVTAGELNAGNRYQFMSSLQSWETEKITEFTRRFSSLEDGQKDQIAAVVANRQNYSQEGRVAALTGEALRHLIARNQATAEREGEGNERDPPPEPKPGAIGGASLGAGLGPFETGQDNGGRDALRLASQHAVHWVLRDPAGAQGWVDSLPAGEAKLWAQRNMARTWAEYDPEAAARWVGSLPEASRAEVARELGGTE